jgi:hypothetical protein
MPQLGIGVLNQSKNRAVESTPLAHRIVHDPRNHARALPLEYLRSGIRAGHHQHHPGVRSLTKHRRRRGRVQAAINAASGLLPKQLPNPPTYKKVNPADQPVLILGLSSDLMTLHQLDQYADPNLAQRISMLPDVGQVVIFGQQKYAPTVQLNPAALAARGIGMDDDRRTRDFSGLSIGHSAASGCQV